MPRSQERSIKNSGCYNLPSSPCHSALALVWSIPRVMQGKLKNSLPRRISHFKYSIFLMIIGFSLTSCSPRAKKIQANIEIAALVVTFDQSFKIPLDSNFTGVLTDCVSSDIQGTKVSDSTNAKMRFKNSKLKEGLSGCIVKITPEDKAQIKSKPITITKNIKGLLSATATAAAPVEESGPTIQGTDSNITATLKVTIDAASEVDNSKHKNMPNFNSISCTQGNAVPIIFKNSDAGPGYIMYRANLTNKTQVFCSPETIEITYEYTVNDEVKTEAFTGKLTPSTFEITDVKDKQTSLFATINLIKKVQTKTPEDVKVKVKLGSCKEGEVFDLATRKCIEKNSYPSDR